MKKPQILLAGCKAYGSKGFLSIPEGLGAQAIGNSAFGSGIFIERTKLKQVAAAQPKMMEDLLHISGNIVENVDTFYKGPAVKYAVFDRNHFKNGRIFLDVTEENPAGKYIAVPDGMTADDLRSLAVAVGKATLTGQDATAVVEKSPWWPALLQNGANAATLIGVLASSAAALLG